MIHGYGDIFGRRSTDYDPYPLARKLAFVEPRYFKVEYVINPHMQCPHSGEPHKINFDLAMTQWHDLIAVYRSLGFSTQTLEPLEGCPDMVFCANQSLPYLDAEGRSSVLLSHMASPTRHLEVAAVADGLESLGVRVSSLQRSRDPDYLFEGTGDALWVPGRKLICGGYGFRTQPQVYEQVHAITGAPVVLFELEDPRFYHLDTCLSILNESTVLACEEAFTKTGWRRLNDLFERVICAPLEEADAPGFACNAHCPDQKHVIIHRQAVKTHELLAAEGFIPVSVDTSEFIKSGGSVFCMKLCYF
jgi:N-dimethylarginine dimethylaminohydrolase